ncbi:MAG TPA: hypothetical protein VGQ12_07570 [Candidatus Angelobacter sp.]|jgi:hypothetical protein|nr:hypothetical protein [Candidatus Angelobacter sp.]
MNRRNFLQLAALAVAGQAAERVFPFRVYSIPKNIVVASNWDQLIMPPSSLYGMPYYFPPGCLGSVGPWMGISRAEFIPFTTLKKDSETAEAARTLAKALDCPHTYRRAESL